MKIKPKLLLSFLSIILLTIVLGFVSYSKLNSLSNRLIPAIRANEGIISGMLKLRKNEKDFLIRSVQDNAFYENGKSKYLDNFESTFVEIEKELAVIADFTNDEAFKKGIALYDALLTEYKSDFLKVVEAKKERGFEKWGIVGELRKSVHNVESKLSSVGEHDNLLVKLLMIRRHEKDFLLRHNLKEQDNINKRIDEFHKLLITSDLNTEDKSEFKNLFSEYKKNFDLLVKIDKKIGITENDGLTGKYRNTIHQIEPLTKQGSAKLSKDVESEVKKAYVVILLTLSLVVLFSLFLVFYLSSIIAKPLQQMSSVGKMVAGGDLSVTMPNVKTKDEVKDIHVVMTALIGALKYHMNK